MKLIVDNPVLRYMLRTRRRQKWALWPALVPLAGIGILVVATEIWRQTGMGYNLSVWHWDSPFGYATGPVDLAVFAISGLYWIHCLVVPLRILEDPLRRAVRDHAGLQLVATGLTPTTWLAGHFLATCLELVLSAAAFAPLFAVCVFFGRVALPHVALILAAGLILGISARMLWLFTLRCPGTGAATACLLLLSLLIPVTLTSAVWTPLAALSPLPLLGGMRATSALLGTAYAGSHTSWFSGALVTLVAWPSGSDWIGVFVRAHAVLWCLTLPGVLAGGIRLHLDWSHATAPSQMLPEQRDREAGMLHPAARVSLGDVMRLFSANRTGAWGALWEWLHLSFVSVGLALIASVWLMHLAGLSDHGLRTATVLGTLVALAVGIAMGLCFDRGVLSQRRVSRYLVPPVGVALLRTGGLLLGIWYLEGTFAEGVTPTGSLLPVAVLLLVTVIGIAVWQSLAGHSRPAAQVTVLVGSLVWLIGVALISLPGWLPLTGAAGMTSALLVGLSVTGMALCWRRQEVEP